MSAKNIQGDTLHYLPLIVFSYAAHAPGADMAKRFGWNSAPGIKIQLKTKRNFLISVEGNYLFGFKINEPGFLQNISTKEGYIIGADGQYADLRISERGYTMGSSLGKLFTKSKSGLGHGLIISGGAGFVEHKVNIQDINETVPSLQGKYTTGYDRLTRGIYLSEFIGYMYLSRNKLINFHFGVELLQAITQSSRPVNFDTRVKNSGYRSDILNGVRFGWILPLYKRPTNEFYTR